MYVLIFFKPRGILFIYFTLILKGPIYVYPRNFCFLWITEGDKQCNVNKEILGYCTNDKSQKDVWSFKEFDKSTFY